MRRIYVSDLVLGVNRLADAQAHHVRDVLRLEPGAPIEAFDAIGHRAAAIISSVDSHHVTIEVNHIELPGKHFSRITVASAVPKGDRADWMIEKLSELGAEGFIPLQTDRSIVHPESGKLQRWNRIAMESARQCSRNGILQIGKLTPIRQLLEQPDTGARLALSLADDAIALPEVVRDLPARVTLFVGPEGDWSPDELGLFAAGNIRGVRLTDSVLRVETAAMAAVAVLETLRRSH